MASRIDGRWLIFFFLFGVVLLISGIKLFPVAFPEASIDFHISRSQALELSRSFLQARGFDTSSFRNTVSFGYDDEAKTYLERTLGLREANRLMGSTVNVWYWQARWFRPLEKEEFIVRLDPSGRLVGFERVLLEEEKIRSIFEKNAQILSEEFLKAYMGFDPADFDLVERKVIERPKRTDYFFGWERCGFKAKEATYRVEVEIHGDTVGGYRQYLKVPESWKREYQELRSRNELFQLGATLAGFVLFCFLLIFLFFRIRSAAVRWNFPKLVGAITAFLILAEGMNDFPLQQGAYETTQAYGTFVMQYVFRLLFSAFMWGAVIGVITAAGQTIYREIIPNKIPIHLIFTLRGLRSYEFFSASISGYSLAFLHLGYVTLFYFLGAKVGVWSPAEIRYTDAVSTPMPWLYPLVMAFQASVSEEFVFRLFAIPFIKKYLKSNFLAVFIPAAIWGFLHSNYPQMPAYIRGIEVTLIGVLAGYIFLRHGIAATLIWHYTIDALLIGLFLFRSTSLYFKVSGAIVVGIVLFPLMFAVLGYIHRRRFVNVEDLLGESVYTFPDIVRPHLPEKAVSVAPEGTSSRRPMIFAVSMMLLFLSTFLLKFEAPGTGLGFCVDRQQVARIADDVIKDYGLDPSRFRRIVGIINSESQMPGTYVYRIGGVRALNRLFREEVPPILWQARYFRPLEKESFTVEVTLDGRCLSFSHEMEERAEGASLSQDAARKLAEDHLRNEKGIDLSLFKLVTASTEKRERRSDHFFVWEKRDPFIGEGRIRISLRVQGDRVDNFEKYLKIPDTWEQEEKKVTILDGVVAFALGVIGLGGLAFFLYALGRGIGRYTLRWRTPLWAGGAMVLADLILFMNNLPTFFATYDTQTKLGSFISARVMVLLTSLIFIFLLTAGICVLALSLIEERFGIPLPGHRSNMYRDAAFSSVITSGILLGYGNLFQFVCARLPAVRRFAPGPVLPHNIDSIFPAISAYVMVLHYLLLVPVLFMGWWFLTSLRSRALGISLVGACLVLMSLAGVRSIWQFSGNLLFVTSFACIAYFLARHLLGFNIVAWFSSALCMESVAEGWNLVRQSAPFFRWNGIVLHILAFFMVFTLVVLWKKEAKRFGSG